MKLKWKIDKENVSKGNMVTLSLIPMLFLIHTKRGLGTYKSLSLLTKLYPFPNHYPYPYPHDEPNAPSWFLMNCTT